MESKSKGIANFFYTWVLVFIIWYAFTTSFSPAELITGGIVSFVIAYLNYKSFTCCGAAILSPKRLFYVFKYLIVFLIALLKANLQVATIVLSPSLPVKPGIVCFKTKLNNDFAKLVLANSITLTPGTLTVDLIDDKFYIHWLKVETTDPDGIYNEIAGKFESILLKIFNK